MTLVSPCPWICQIVSIILAYYKVSCKQFLDYIITFGPITSILISSTFPFLAAMHTTVVISNLFIFVVLQPSSLSDVQDKQVQN